MRHGFLNSRLAELAGDYPVSGEHRDLINLLGGEFVYAAPLRGRFRGRWLALVRFGRVVESRFGLSAEVPVIYDHHQDLQIRTVDSIPDYLEQLPEDRRTIGSDMCFISTPDPQMTEKAHRWSRPDRLLIPLPQAPDGDAQPLLASMSRVIFSRDLYSVRGAVTGRDFFGRQRLMTAVLDDVHNFRVPGVFGMRKSGKTSLLQELVRASKIADRRAGRKRVFVYQDLEHLSGFEAGDPVPELIADVAESIRRALKAAGLRTMEIADLPPNAGPTQFRTALDSLLDRLDEGAELVLLLDEVEYLCPPSAEREPGRPSEQKVPQLFGVLRKLVQERQNFGLVISGLASASVEAGELYGRPNPLFSFATPYYLGPFSEIEGKDLLRGVGKQVGLSWSNAAVETAMAESGGSAMLLRELGSAVLRALPEDRTDHMTVDRDDVTAQLGAWRRRVSSNLREVVLHLRRFYPDESALMDVLMTSSDDFAELSYDYPDQIHRLEQLGIIEQVGGVWIPSRVLQMGWELASRDAPAGPKAATSSTDAPDHSARPTRDLLPLDESQWLERKQTATYNSHTGSKDRDLERAVVKSVAALLNAEGGVLLVGVHNDKTVVGLAEDYSVASRRKDRDGFENWLYTTLTRELGGPTVAKGVTVSIEQIESHEICRIDVEPSSSAVWVGSEGAFYVRVGNSTRQFNPREALEYCRSRWP
jgi:hypothetical protein